MLTLIPLKTKRPKNAFVTLYPQERTDKAPKKARAGTAKGPSTEVMRATQSFTQDAMVDVFETVVDSVRIYVGFWAGQLLPNTAAAQRVEKNVVDS